MAIRSLLILDCVHHQTHIKLIISVSKRAQRVVILI